MTEYSVCQFVRAKESYFCCENFLNRCEYLRALFTAWVPGLRHKQTGKRYQ